MHLVLIGEIFIESKEHSAIVKKKKIPFLIRTFGSQSSLNKVTKTKQELLKNIFKVSSCLTHLLHPLFSLPKSKAQALKLSKKPSDIDTANLLNEGETVQIDPSSDPEFPQTQVISDAKYSSPKADV